MLDKITLFYRLRAWLVGLGLIILGYIFAQSTVTVDADILRGILIAALFMAWGYSFNRLCDKPLKQWRWAESAMVLLPLFPGLWLTASYYPDFVFFVLLALFLNIGYSFPTIFWKGIPALSVAINVYLFGVVFLSGTYLAKNAIESDSFCMSIYFALFFVPAQLLHEMSHAVEDNRYAHIIKYRKRYITVFIAFIIVEAAFSFFLYFLLKLKPLFLLTSLLFWGINIYYLLSIGLWSAFSIKKAQNLRLFFRHTGIILGFFYLICFL